MKTNTKYVPCWPAGEISRFREVHCLSDAGCNVSIVPAGGVGPGQGGVAGGGYTGKLEALSNTLTLSFFFDTQHTLVNI